MGLVVLSLCDGISTGQQVLKELNIDVDTYFSSEVEISAIEATQYNFPKTIQIGDIREVSYKDGVLHTEKGNFNIPKIDLLLSGTPCVSFSVAGKKENMRGLSGELFYEFVRILKEVNPLYFFFENVKMSENVAKEINNTLGVNYIYFNSVDLGCHIRKRYYWSNLVKSKEDLVYTRVDKHLEDIVDLNIPFDLSCNDILQTSTYSPSKGKEGVICINPKSKNTKKGQTNQRSRIYDIKGKCPTICASLFDLKITMDHKYYRKLTINECEKLQSLPIGYTSSMTRFQAGKALGNGWHLETVKCFLIYLKGK